MYHAKERGHDIRFTWISLHVRISRRGHADRLAKSTCAKQSMDIDLGAPLAGISHITKASFKEDFELINSQHLLSCSIKHYGRLSQDVFIYAL